MKPNQVVRIDGTTKEQFNTVKALKTSSRYRNIFVVRKAIQNFTEAG